MGSKIESYVVAQRTRVDELPRYGGDSFHDVCFMVSLGGKSDLNL